MTTQHPTRGATVNYHGSLEDFHGPATVLGVCGCRCCWGLGRLALRTAGGEPLTCVRGDSVTPPGGLNLGD